MSSTVEQLSPSQVKLTIEVGPDELKPALDRTYREFASQIAVPGFRKGKVPAAVIDQRVGREAVTRQALSAALPGLYAQALSEHSLSPLGEPEIDVSEPVKRDRIEITAVVDVRPDFALPDFAAIEVEVDAVSVSDEQIEAEIDTMRRQSATRTVVERPAADGDLVTISLQASQNGTVLEDAATTEVPYEVGSGRMLDGLDEAVTGLSAGESATFASKLVGGAYKDQDVDVEVTITQVQDQQLPTDDEVVESLGEVETIDELRQRIREWLEHQAQAEQAGAARDAVLEKAIADLELELPQRVKAAEIEGRRQAISAQLQQAGLSLEDYLQDSEEADSPEAFWADVEQRATSTLIAQMLLDSFAESEAIQVEQAELTQHIMMLAQRQRTSPDEVAKHMMEHNHLGEYMTDIRRTKALAGIVAQAKVVDSNGDPVSLVQAQPDDLLAENEALDDDLEELADEFDDDELDDFDDAETGDAETDDAETDDEGDQSGDASAAEDSATKPA